MKIRVFSVAVTVFILLAMSSTFAQSSVKFGVKAGLSVSTLDIGNDYIEFDSRPAFCGGGFVVFDLPGLWAIQIEGLYVQKGAQVDLHAVDEEGQDLGEVTFTYGINYVEVPVLARISMGATPVHILAGMAMGFKLSSKITASDYPGEYDGDDWDGVAETDFSLVLGLGMELPTGFGGVIFDARYTRGMADLDDGIDVELKNRAFLVSAGVAF